MVNSFFIVNRLIQDSLGLVVMAGPNDLHFVAIYLAETNAIYTAAITSPTISLFDLQGRRLDNQPTNKGLYIKNGKKVVVK